MIVGKVNANYEMTTLGTWMTYFGSAVRDHGVAIAHSSTSGGRLAVCGLSEANSNAGMEFPMGNAYTTDAGYGLLALFDQNTGIRTYCTHLWATLPGYANNSGPADVDYDVQGNLYLVGAGYMNTANFNNAVVNPSGADDYTSISHGNQMGFHIQDSYVARFDPNMNLTWLTALGGPNDDRAYACAVDHVNSRLVVVGETNTANDLNQPDCPTSGIDDFPLCYPSGSYQQDRVNGYGNCSTLACGSDGFVTVFSLSNLKLLYSSYFGPGIEDDAITDVETDSQGNIYLVGWSEYHSYAADPCQWSLDLWLVPCDAGGYFDEGTGPSTKNHFIRRLNEDFELTWSTWIAGNQDEYWAYIDEIGRPRIAMDADDNVYMYGSTASGNLPGAEPVAPYVPNASYYSNGIHADLSTNIIPATYDTYLLKFNPATGLTLSTLFGGPGQDHACGLTVLGSRVYVSGTTSSQLFPTHAPTISGAEPYVVSVPSAATGDLDAFMAQLGYDYTVGDAEEVQEPGAHVKLFPNPTMDELTISGIGPGVVTMEVVDLTGRTVMRSTSATGNAQVMNVKEVPAGSYLLRIRTAEGMWSRVVIKQ
jgi:Secretion system C-terminal sorting domain